MSCGEYGEDKIQLLSTKAENGRAVDWFDNRDSIPSMEALRKQFPLSILRDQEPTSGAEETSQSNQRSVLYKRGFLKAKRDSVRNIYPYPSTYVTYACLGNMSAI